MPSSSTSEPQSVQQDPDVVVRIGGWLFRKRTSIPLPIVAVLLLVPATRADAHARWTTWTGVAVVALGELLRLWGVHHIGSVSRTRSERLGPLIDHGPFAKVRNPLYIGNILLWIGFAFSAHLPWLAPVVLVLLGLEYHAIVRWEERLLESRLGESYRTYLTRVPRWRPNLAGRSTSGHDAAFSWTQTLYSERGTLIAIAAGYLLLGLKARF
ncbi:MAG TPA: isoprenylcysteine carboxylmethyltransferase family protein [Vicinamibacterales bacterium]|nr:isoprenylcysteine carboxylmethyltransferase family protein [Vicinamibacterales bacterium]